MRASRENAKPTLLRRVLACLVSAAMVVAFTPVVAWGAETTVTVGSLTIRTADSSGLIQDTDYTYSADPNPATTSTLTIMSGKPITITGTTTTDHIVVASDVTANITLNGVDIQFSDGNSFKGEAALSLLPVNAYKEHPENLAPVKPQGANADGVLSAAAIYGANASGKTNLLKAVDFSRCVVLGLIGPGSPEWSQRFVGNDSPTCFEYSIISDGVRYTYSLSIDSNGVVEEELRARPKGERLVFRRSMEDDGTYSVVQGSSYSGIKGKLKGFLDKGPVLKLLSSYGLPSCSAVLSWFEDGIAVIDRVRPVQFVEILEKLKNLDEGDFRKVIGAVGAADLGITGAQLTVSELTAQEREQQRVATDKIKAIYEALTGQGKEDVPSPNQKITFQFQHVIDGRKVGFGFEDESAGTLTMLNLAADFIDAIACGKTLLVDEIERSLHPVLLKALVGLFSDRELNTRNAQLVFTTHALSFLDNGMLRRDQIWFVEKNPGSGSSELYPLSSYSPRKDDNILNRYLYGAYGALPYVEEVYLNG